MTEAATELPLYDYPLEEGSGLDVYGGEETTLAPLDDSYLSPAEEARRRRTFGRGNSGRGGRRQSGGRRGGRRQSGRRAGRRNQKNRRGGQRQGRRNNRRG